ncbi:hypothetical protein DAPPUDRAFT_307662 [Daphnia pulex]|uniref:Uncharacterized protein n=1 Tax=Daphnia pulex TaxID=6669 RepID=E9H3N5_DAPPU|nr:hypothetical protein DAPPUDRAFT_307662 [Daphnia pulex]|eukprot:EFX73667.1 hypothetical protein DAPPUDRAFT_307662 [Daphnia pulex]
MKLTWLLCRIRSSSPFALPLYPVHLLFKSTVKYKENKLFRCVTATLSRRR